MKKLAKFKPMSLFQEYLKIDPSIRPFVDGINDLDKAYLGLCQAFANINTSVYIVDPVSKRLKYVNHDIKANHPQIQAGQLCYQALGGSDAPCDGCPFKDATDMPEHIHFEITNEKEHTCHALSASRLLGEEDPLYLVNSMDITTLKQSNAINHADEITLRKQAIIDIMKDAIQNDRFEVYYQPIYNIKENCYDRAEALLRLLNTSLGTITPSEFIPIAEEAGLIVEMGYIVIEKVAQKITEVRKINPLFKNINVNVSVLQLMDKQFAHRFLDILNKYDVSPTMVELEMTETSLIRSYDEMSSIMNNLKSYGIEFSLDDFGIGYSNLRHLVDLPFNYIKLDRHFLSEISTSDRNQTFLKSLINLTKTLNYGVVAEGVEHLEQFKILSESNCDYIQGFYMATPMPGADLNRFLYYK